MTTISVLYPREADARFDYDYYERSHLPLVAERWGEAGLVGAWALKGIAGADGGPPAFFAMAFIRFKSLEAFQAAMGGPHAAEINGDIANFTSVTPIIQLNEAMGAH